MGNRSNLRYHGQFLLPSTWSQWRWTGLVKALLCSRNRRLLKPHNERWGGKYRKSHGRLRRAKYNRTSWEDNCNRKWIRLPGFEVSVPLDHMVRQRNSGWGLWIWTKEDKGLNLGSPTISWALWEDVLLPCAFRMWFHRACSLGMLSVLAPRSHFHPSSKALLQESSSVSSFQSAWLPLFAPFLKLSLYLQSGIHNCS